MAQQLAYALAKSDGVRNLLNEAFWGHDGMSALRWP